MIHYLSLDASKFPQINNSLSNIFTNRRRSRCLSCKFVSPWRRKEASIFRFSLFEKSGSREKWKISFVSQRVFPLLPPAYFNIWTRRNEAWREKRWKLKGSLARVLSTPRNRGPILCTRNPCIVFAPMIDGSTIRLSRGYLARFPIPLDSVFGLEFLFLVRTCPYFFEGSFRSRFQNARCHLD